MRSGIGTCTLETWCKNSSKRSVPICYSATESKQNTNQLVIQSSPSTMQKCEVLFLIVSVPTKFDISISAIQKFIVMLTWKQDREWQQFHCAGSFCYINVQGMAF